MMDSLCRYIGPIIVERNSWDLLNVYEPHQFGPFDLVIYTSGAIPSPRSDNALHGTIFTMERTQMRPLIVSRLYAQ